MSSAKNEQELGRYIPAEVRKQVRERCHHGCIVCGKFPWHYDHLGIEFVDASAHNPDDLILLCGYHHDCKTRKQIADEFLRAKQKNPAAAGRSPVWSTAIGPGPVEISFAGALLTGTKHGGISVNGSPVLRAFVDPAEPAQLLLSGSFLSKDGKEIVSFEQNEIRVASGSWDFDVVGSNYTVKNSSGRTVLEMTVCKERPYLRVSFLEMRLAGGYFLYVEDGQFGLRPPESGGTSVKFSGSSVHGPGISFGESLRTGDNIEFNFPFLGNIDSWQAEVSGSR